MHPFRTLPEAIDRIVCAGCGHPAWDHCSADACSECRADAACRAFSPAGFVPAEPYAVRLRLEQIDLE